MQDDDYEDDGLEDLVDAIQVGDRSEGAAAVRKLMKRAAPDPETISRGVRATLAQDRVHAEMYDGARYMNDRFPDIANDELLAEAGMTAFRKEVEKDLKEHVGVDDEDLKPLRGNNQLMMRAHQELRAAGKGRPAKELFTVVGEEMGRRFGIKPTAPGRIGEVRRINGSDPDVAARSEERRREAIHQARAARGFRNDDGHVEPIRRSAVQQSSPQREAEAKRRASATAYMTQRQQDNERRALGRGGAYDE